MPNSYRLLASAKHPAGKLRNVAHLFGEEPLFYVRRKGEFETPYAAKFRELVLAQHPARPKKARVQPDRAVGRGHIVERA